MSSSPVAPMIVVCTDFSPCSEVAVAQAADIARVRQCRVLLIHVSDPPKRNRPTPEHWNEDARRKLRSARKKYFGDFSDNDVQYDIVPGEVVDAICNTARTHRAFMVVLGSHSRTGLPRQLLGSVAENTVRHAPCSVLVVREPA